MPAHFAENVPALARTGELSHNVLAHEDRQIEKSVGVVLWHVNIDRLDGQVENDSHLGFEAHPENAGKPQHNPH
eukprot:CAMPEP_0119325490 /NCGR_PEP_ID=MMETSP1333-20130426/65949_1 /TAXON_ID=418940 /ORGANISM="Scyphosphaera apsteinii, Strain RCC1455" /LENGTH=73 /DNA_ID=CAMNT_0007333489 /DNA_START=501 /DNA_END=722 /DNA_ORIENTATION=+